MRIAFTSALAIALGATGASRAETAPSRPAFAPYGTVHVPAFESPPSEFSSPRLAPRRRAGRTAGGAPPERHTGRHDAQGWR